MPTCGLGERRRIVDAVAGHGDEAALVLKLLDRGGLLSGSTSASTSSMPSLRADRLGRDAAVAGQHDDANALVAQRRERLDGALLDRIGDGDEPGGCAVDRDQHRRPGPS